VCESDGGCRWCESECVGVMKEWYRAGRGAERNAHNACTTLNARYCSIVLGFSFQLSLWPSLRRCLVLRACMRSGAWLGVWVGSVRGTCSSCQCERRECLCARARLQQNGTQFGLGLFIGAFIGVVLQAGCTSTHISQLVAIHPLQQHRAKERGLFSL
jgi:hypothetical protein